MIETQIERLKKYLMIICKYIRIKKANLFSIKISLIESGENN